MMRMTTHLMKMRILFAKRVLLLAFCRSDHMRDVCIINSSCILYEFRHRAWLYTC